MKQGSVRSRIFPILQITSGFFICTCANGSCSQSWESKGAWSLSHRVWWESHSSLVRFYKFPANIQLIQWYKEIISISISISISPICIYSDIAITSERSSKRIHINLKRISRSSWWETQHMPLSRQGGICCGQCWTDQWAPLQAVLGHQGWLHW